MEEEQVDKLYHEGVHFLLEKEYNQAIEILKVCAHHSAHPGALRAIGEAYLGLSQPREAVTYLAASVGISPNPKAYFLLGKTLLQCGFLSKAEHAVERALDQL